MREYSQHSKFSLCAIKGLQELESCLSNSGLEQSLLELVKLRIAQLNDCEPCKEVHTGDAWASGQTLEHLSALKNWKTDEDFSEREKMALKWAEEVKSPSTGAGRDSLYQEVSKYFDEQELVVLTMAVNVVDSWKRLSLAFNVPGKSLAKGNFQGL